MQVDSISPLGTQGCSSCSFSWFTDAVGKNEATNLFNTIQGKDTVSAPSIFDIVNSYQSQKYTSQDDIKADPAFVNLFLQYPNQVIRDLALEITAGLRTDDEKVQAIQEWVVNHIQYQEDKVQYGYDELWVPPVMTLRAGAGDCEDGAFLIMSLALNAGVDPNRLRFYGGEVLAGQGAATGGHGWVAYRRESDDEWVVADFSYYPDLRAMDKRITMKEDDRYVSQYFMFEVGEIITSSKNRVREPDITYTANGYIKPNVLLPGTWMSQYA
jgi:predicted transglutaminase-like cysteine proteinase